MPAPTAIPVVNVGRLEVIGEAEVGKGFLVIVVRLSLAIGEGISVGEETVAVET
jgi:hypothetical protein